jgi:hypothetical protein
MALSIYYSREANFWIRSPTVSTNRSTYCSGLSTLSRISEITVSLAAPKLPRLPLVVSHFECANGNQYRAQTDYHQNRGLESTRLIEWW